MASGDLRQLLEFIGGWDGFEIAEWSTDEALAPDALGLPAPRVTIVLRPKADAVKRCGRCGRPVEAIHDVSVRRVRDLPLAQYDVWLVVPHARVTCPACGPTVEAIPWLDRYQRVTKRFAETLVWLGQILPITQVAARYHVSWDTVKQLDKRALAARLGRERCLRAEERRRANEAGGPSDRALGSVTSRDTSAHPRVWDRSLSLRVMGRKPVNHRVIAERGRATNVGSADAGFASRMRRASSS